MQAALVSDVGTAARGLWSVAALGALQDIEAGAAPIAPEQYVHRTRAAIGRPCGRKRQYIAAHVPVREPLGGGMFEHRHSTRRAQTATVHHQHSAEPLAYRVHDK